jgi:HK97 family phage prohead protease
MSEIEKRTIEASGLEMRSDEGHPVIEGYAAVFNAPANLGQFDEMILPGAFKRTLEADPDVRATIEHEGGLTTIGRTRNRTLFLAEDGHGLRVRIFPPNTQAARDAMELIRGGFVNQMSFAFRVAKGGDEWKQQNGRSLRLLKDVDLHDGDVSIVSYPAYSSTSAEARARAEQLNGINGGGAVDSADADGDEPNDARARMAAKKRTIQLFEVKR